MTGVTLLRKSARLAAITSALFSVATMLPVAPSATAEPCSDIKVIFARGTNDAVVAGLTTSWLVPVIALALLPTAIAYTLGIMGIARLQPRFGSLVGLSEVMFAVLAAWVLLGEAVTAMQAAGGAVVLAGLALARAGDRSEQQDTVTWPDAPLSKPAPARLN